MRKMLLSLAALASILALAAPASAQYCEGTVRGLSNNYNPSTGSGFLAVRAGPRRSATQYGELFNGDKVEIFRRSGYWYKIASLDSSLEGWASARWIRNDCRY
jgi:Bacterial SH3 domain